MRCRLARATSALGFLALAAIPAWGNGVGLFSMQEASAPLVLQLSTSSAQSAYSTVYSVFADGAVLRERLHHTTGDRRSPMVQYLSRLAVSNLLSELETERVLEFEQRDLDTHFPNGVPRISDAAFYTLTVPASALPGERVSGREDRRIFMMQPDYLARHAPTFSAARGLDALARKLRALFD